MKKWHMEGIVGLSGKYQQKMIIPDLKRADVLTGQKLTESRSESYVIRILRGWIALFLKYF